MVMNLASLQSVRGLDTESADVTRDSEMQVQARLTRRR
jgi:hypothetical protein